MIKPTRRSITNSASILKSDVTFPACSIPIPIRLTVINRQWKQWFYKFGNFKIKNKPKNGYTPTLKIMVLSIEQYIRIFIFCDFPIYIAQRQNHSSAILILAEKLVVDSIPIPSILKKWEFSFQFWNHNCPNTDSNDRNILPVNLWLRPPASPLQQFCCMIKIHLKYTNPAR